ncbi:unnamed protein product [Caenorhabditis angaria]|uniref:T20D4.11-like domain-containing protein n=1 Tax=Caenorhabditis angaria TaxID=860376 RepID=A0A9P1MRX1_9PELO|nr:unnamed protein product [Caenorhabditis angaria]
MSRYLILLFPIISTFSINFSNETCSNSDSLILKTCDKKLMGFARIMEQVEFAGNLNEETENCYNLKYCYTETNCYRNKGKLVSNIVKNYCDLLIFNNVAFKDCTIALLYNTVIRKGCAKTRKNIQVPYTLKTTNDEKCEAILDKKHCAREMIIDNCGELKWDQFLEKYTDFVWQINGCDLEMYYS